MKTCKFKCKGCGFKWKGYRTLPITNKDGEITRYDRHKRPGMTVCPKCKEDQIVWTNYEDFAIWYRKNVNDGGCGANR